MEAEDPKTDNQPVTSPTAEAKRSAVPRFWVTRADTFWTALVTAVVLVVLTMGLDFLLLRESRWSPLGMAAVSNVVLGVIAFVLLLRLLRYSRQRREQVLKRLEVIDEMNHHIRNALQVIAFNARPVTRSDWELAEIKQAVDRIHWALREVLPKMEPEFEAYEGSPRDQQSDQNPPAAGSS